MQTRRGTVLGKRGHHESSSSFDPASKTQVVCDQLHTPESSPNTKRPRTSLTLEEDGSNKENIPPLKSCSTNGETTPPRRARALRRSATEDITPTRLGIQRSMSTSSLPSTPSREIASLAISTPPPTPPNKLLPLHARIRGLLRSTCNNSQIQLSGRETERATILDFFSPFLDDSSMNHDKIRSSMFISGSPGTGKTAFVNSIIRQLSAEHRDLKVVSINCMSLKSVDALWERLVEDLSGPSKKKPTVKRLKGREAIRSILDDIDMKCILVLDELDHITPNDHSLSSIFTLAESLPSTLRLVGIANTHTLTSSNVFLGSTNVITVHFTPYTPTELQEIIHHRFANIPDDGCTQVSAQIKEFLPNPTLMLLTKKVAALTGDVRCLFEVLRGAIDIAVRVASTQKSSEENPLDTPPPTVTPQHILAAFKSYTPVPSKSTPTATSSTSTNSEILAKISNLGLQARLVLLAIILGSKRLEAGLSLSQSTSSSPKKPTASPIKRSFSMPNPSKGSCIGISTNSLNAYYNAVLSRVEHGVFEPVSRGEFGDLLGVLEGVGLVSLSSTISTAASKGKKTWNRATSFAGTAKNVAGAVGNVKLVEGVWGDEVLRCLGATGTDATVIDPREEEIRGIWVREKSRLSKDLKAAASSGKKSDLDVFSSAFQR